MDPKRAQTVGYNVTGIGGEPIALRANVMGRETREETLYTTHDGMELDGKTPGDMSGGPLYQGFRWRVRHDGV